MTSSQAIMTFNDVSFRYMEIDTCLSNVNLTVHEGECVVLTGPSGSGKTTLTRIMNGLIPGFHEGELTGKVMLDGRSIADLEPWCFGEKVGSVFQDARSQFFNSIVEDEIAFSGENYGRDPQWIRERVHSLLCEAGIGHLQHRQLQQLSSGERQKVAVAAACLNLPKLLVMDEPTANLDMVAAREFMHCLQQLKSKRVSMVIAEHRLHYMMAVADRILYMRNGRIEADWTPEELQAFSAEELIQYGLRSPLLQAPSHVMKQTAVQEERIAITVSELSVAPAKFQDTLLETINVTIGRGEVVAITGPNGTGKTMLAKTLCGLIKERAGTIRIDGRKMTARQRLGHIWFVLQDSDYQLFSDSVLNELLLTHEQEIDAAERAEKLLKELDLWELRERHPFSLSGGQKQRLTLAVGMMNKPELIILDEPTSGLDGENMRRVAALIRRMAESDICVMVITHDHELVFSACDRVLFLQEKRVQADLRVDPRYASELLRMMETLQVEKSVS